MTGSAFTALDVVFVVRQLCKGGGLEGEAFAVAPDDGKRFPCAGPYFWRAIAYKGGGLEGEGLAIAPGRRVADDGKRLCGAERCV